MTACFFMHTISDISLRGSLKHTDLKYVTNSCQVSNKKKKDYVFDSNSGKSWHFSRKWSKELAMMTIDFPIFDCLFADFIFGEQTYRTNISVHLGEGSSIFLKCISQEYKIYFWYKPVLLRTAIEKLHVCCNYKPFLLSVFSSFWPSEHHSWAAILCLNKGSHREGRGPWDEGGLISLHNKWWTLDQYRHWHSSCPAPINASS